MPRDHRDPAELIPLKQSTYQVLLALGDEELHGYAVMQFLSEMTGGREVIMPGTLYAALARMVDEGLVEGREAANGDSSGGPRRRYYRRTAFGREVARLESERLRSLLEIAHTQKILKRGAR
jgi:DNA-binding PadR family transcriptional regulator